MYYIGTSLGGCLRSIMLGEVKIEDVMFIITRTAAPDYQSYIGVVKTYQGNNEKSKSKTKKYQLEDFDLNEVLEVAADLWHSGKIHQPRLYLSADKELYLFNLFGFYKDLWLYVQPMNTNTNPIVVEAWEKYKMLDNLTKDD